MRKIKVNMRPRASVLATLICAAAFSPLIPSVRAQDFVLDNYYDCAKATNGKAYCRQVGKGSGYFPVSDDFLERFVALKSGNGNSTPVRNCAAKSQHDLDQYCRHTKAYGGRVRNKGIA